MSKEPTNRSFDELARAVAEGSLSRRGALKLFAGSAIAALIPSRVLADEDDCVRICHVPFDREKEECEPAKAVTRCVSRRERRRHLENHPCDCRGRCADCLSCIPPSAIPCDPADPGNCPGGIGGGCSCGVVSEGGAYCGTEGTNIPCSTSCDCPAGQFCRPFGDGGLCAIAATVCPVP